MIKNVNHVSITVKDVDKVVAFSGISSASPMYCPPMSGWDRK